MMSDKNGRIVAGADQPGRYLPLLKGRRVAVLANHASRVGKVHLVDFLLENQVNVVKIFSPEHGFAGSGDDVVPVRDSVDVKTGIPIISLWNSLKPGDPEELNSLWEGYKKPGGAELADVDIMLFDIQDVGVRFYTYISTLQRFMESAAENGKELLILDRPNPNGFYVDGPVLEEAYRSFIGMQPVPVVYGMTTGEYARMLTGERWLSDPGLNPGLTVIECRNYAHDRLYRLPVPPSPNLPNMASIYLYPSVCFLEGTACSVGRGTAYPFQQFGSPLFPRTAHSFTPRSVVGASDPKLTGQKCFGFLVATSAVGARKEVTGGIRLKWLLKAYELFPDKGSFFNDRFPLLAGSAALRRAVESGTGEAAIQESWRPDLDRFLKIRGKYLLYQDFHG
jgi:uncharacterized protein YbbC (DUF1343 family)